MPKRAAKDPDKIHDLHLPGLAGIEAELSALLGGCRVDLRTANDLQPPLSE
jgi:predicted nucleotidyltransferase